MNNTNRQRKGGIAYYANASTSNDYMLYQNNVTSGVSNANTTTAPQVYVPPNSAPLTEKFYPNMVGGAKECNARYEDCDAFEFDRSDTILYSLNGGCSCNASALMGGYYQDATKAPVHLNNVKGGAFALTPYITAISLLAARLLTDKNVGFFPMQGGNDRRKTRRT